MDNKFKSFDSVVAAIERPLVFASRNNFTALLNIKGLDEVILSLLEDAMSFITCKISKENRPTVFLRIIRNKYV